MKLMFCDTCHDVFKLTFTLRSCECGKVKGKYVDNTNAVTNGKGYSLAIGNGSLVDSIRTMCDVEKQLLNNTITQSELAKMVDPQTVRIDEIRNPCVTHHEGEEVKIWNDEREVYIDVCRLIAWVRPNNGFGNPHTTVDPSL